MAWWPAAVGLAAVIATSGWFPAGAARAEPVAPLTTVGAAPQTDPGGLAPGRTIIPTRDLLRMFRDGGPLMIALAACSFLVLTFALERAICLRRARVIPKPFVKRFLEQLREGELEQQQAMELCQQNGSPIATVFAGAVRKWGRPSVEVEQAAIDSGERAANHLRRYLRLFYGVANLGPLLGLMGTVLGMIQTFNVIATHDALGRAELLAGGIAKALLNTAGGLAVAIPASIFYVFFLSRVDRLIMEMDARAQEVVNLISAEEIQERQARTAKPRRLITRQAA